MHLPPKYCHHYPLPHHEAHQTVPLHFPLTQMTSASLLQFDYPTGIAVHPQNKMIYVSEAVNYRVKILKPNLTLHKLFGSQGSDKGQFGQLRGIAFDSKQNVYISEHRRNTRIQVFTQEGEYLRWLGDTKLDNPYDVCIDSNDIVYVCDTDNNRIYIFDSSGILLHSFGTPGKSPGQFDAPYGYR